VQATATVLYPKGSSFYNSIINKDGPRMLARGRDNDKRQFESPPSSSTVSLRRIYFFSEIRSPRSVTPFFCQNAPIPPKSNKTAPAAKPCNLVKPLSACSKGKKDLKYVVCCLSSVVRRLSSVVCRLYLLSSHVSTLVHCITNFTLRSIH
jgi:hypothetical protein